MPAILIAVTFAWSATQTRSDNKREDKRIRADQAAAEEVRQDATLQTYLDQMSGLMLKEKLLTSKEDDAVRDVARTVTLAALRRLDGERRGAVVRFLHEAQLLVATNVRVDLDGADLRGADLNGADLGSAFLAGAYLAYADLGSAFLGAADLRNTNLAGANLADADLKGAKHLDLGSFIIHLPPKDRKEFLDSQKEFFDSLRPAEFAMFQLSPKTLAMLRREANGG